MNHESLTDAGRRYAEANEWESIVARVALTGHDSGWPLAHVDVAIRACNEKADNREPTDVEMFGAGSR